MPEQGVVYMRHAGNCRGLLASRLRRFFQSVCGLQSGFESLAEPSLPARRPTDAALVTILFFVHALVDLELRPRRHAIHQYVSQTPDAIR
jgi:hypothetical protein